MKKLIVLGQQNIDLKKSRFNMIAELFPVASGGQLQISNLPSQEEFKITQIM